jgi:predicted small lipoprotein YifL
VVKGLVLLCAVVIPLTMTAACGQKGPLYLPPRNGTVVTRPAGSNTTPSTPPKIEQPSATPQTIPPQTSSPQTTGSTPAGKKNNNDSSQPPK